MRVGVYIDRMYLQGGLQRVVANLLQEWDALGWETHLITESGGADVFTLPAATRRHVLLSHPKQRGLAGVLDNFRIVRGLRSFLRVTSLDAVIALSPVANVHLAMAGSGSSTILIGSQYDYAPHHPISAVKRLFLRYFYPRLDALVCATAEATDLAVSAYPGTRGVRIPLWSSPAQGAAGQVVRVADWIRPGRKVFCACGRFNLLKGFRELVEIFDAIKDAHPDWDLLIIGDGEDHDILHEMVAARGLQGRVLMPGWVGNPDEFFAASNIFVFPSRSEGFGLVLIEAMTSGLPCIAYDCKVGPAEIVTHEADGLVVPDGERAAFQAAMIRLARDEPLRRTFATKARLAIRRFDAKAVQPRWDELLSAKRKAC